MQNANQEKAAYNCVLVFPMLCRLRICVPNDLQIRTYTITLFPLSVNSALSQILRYISYETDFNIKFGSFL